MHHCLVDHKYDDVVFSFNHYVAIAHDDLGTAHNCTESHSRRKINFIQTPTYYP